MSGVNVAIIGTGLVGSAFVRQLQAVQKKSPGVFNVILVARSKATYVSKDYSPLSLDSYSTGSSDLLNIEQIAAYLEKSPKPVILVDNTSNEDWANSYPLFLSKSISVATPNKKAFSSSLDLWKKVFGASNGPKGGLVYHEATVGAGLPVLGPLNDLVATGDEIVKIDGIVSGTLSYIFNEFSTIEGSTVKFSDVVKKAKSLGYTEPDPRDDLNGLDVARKVTILARLSGLPVESPTSFPVDSLIPKPLESAASADEFLEKLPEYDGELDKLRQEAQAENKVLRFVGKVDIAAGAVKVGIEKYDASHPFASLKGSDNVISIQSERYASPLIIQGAGAGAEVTAAGVLADVFKIEQRLRK
ncbi:homoserine dehydrogenase [Sugiyamaella lignohabitans]|uniref:Homoserine dehydrogenase n=1 Tax=Sugiyamaella lignohabitans TaxID=796027 RepID=A0A161HKL5_9ASCO|nr:homoserine dehydrogenase [Sugiyamaella lignohabitans]ANB12288.1 homoserine dehydrogenase [Sugiyamaella lignohabitans]